MPPRPFPTPWSHTKRALFSVAAAASLFAGLRSVAGPVVPPRTHTGAGNVLYFVLTDRFANGSTANDRGGLSGGPEETGFDPTRISHYHGGDFVGLTAHLDYLKRLGITEIWVTPPLRNKPVQLGSAGYHGYWILDFENIDPHLGTNEEFREFIRQAHARGLRVIMDIVVNHTADVIQYADHDTTYRGKAAYPYRDAVGIPFDVQAVAYNGLNDPKAFPELSAERSFPHVPVLPPAERNAKNPAWLNDVTVYHNRGNSSFQGESSLDGDFVGLDDLFTEQPRVVEGFIAIYRRWLETGVDGFRIDTMRHVNAEFWQAFGPAIQARARELGRTDFLQFGEVANDAGDPSYLAEFSTGTMPVDTTTDFGFFAAALRYVSQHGTAAALGDFFARDDYYLDHDSNVHVTPTFLGNHDAGRFGYFLLHDNPGASPEQLAALVKFGHGLMLLSRGQPVIYYGDEQGMIGRGGNDMQAREDMFASQAPDFRDAPLLATKRTGADDKFDEQHPFYRFLSRLTALRNSQAALRTGAMLVRPTVDPEVFAFSRVDRRERIEWLAAFNNARTTKHVVRVPTSQPGGRRLVEVFDSTTPDAAPTGLATTDADGGIAVALEPLQFTVWRADTSLAPVAGPLSIALSSPAAGARLAITEHTIDGQRFPSRCEIRAEVSGGDGVAEVTFALKRHSRPGQFELLGTDETAPYRVFWTPPADLEPGDEIEFVATVNDLRGRTAEASAGGIAILPTTTSCGIPHSHTPQITAAPATTVALDVSGKATLAVTATGTAPLDYQWMCDDEIIIGATQPQLVADRSGRYRVLVHNLAGTAISEEIVVGK
ncbi:MAG TPA: alpha-amylase family glycosyl hydrolase [Candidatus Didemnitutus sp.]|nr:alpha-amylase family glycosyl hydrolase [Candidatus Didemnitutus sp.]